MIEAKELDWASIIAGEGIGNGRKKKEVLMAFYLNYDDQVIMTYPTQLLMQKPVFTMKEGVKIADEVDRLKKYKNELTDGELPL